MISLFGTSEVFIPQGNVSSEDSGYALMGGVFTVVKLEKEPQ